MAHGFYADLADLGERMVAFGYPTAVRCGDKNGGGSIGGDSQIDKQGIVVEAPVTGEFAIAGLQVG